MYVKLARGHKKHGRKRVEIVLCETVCERDGTYVATPENCGWPKKRKMEMFERILMIPLLKKL